MKRIYFLLFCVFLIPCLGIIACDGSDPSASSGQADDDDDNDGDDEAVDEDARLEYPLGLVITTEDMVEAWREFAWWKDRTGLRTDVVSLEEILGSEADDPRALRDYLKDAYARGVRYVLMGGDADQIPFLRAYSEVWALQDYYGHAPIQTYFEELDADWDADGDGILGEQGEDLTLAELRQVEISVGRVPTETPEEVDGFVGKLIRYESGAGRVAERATAPLFLGDVAETVPVFGDIDGGIMHEQLIADYLPEHFRKNMRRLYSTEFYADLVGAEVGTRDRVFSAFEDEGYTFVVTNTHGNFKWLTNLMSLYTVPYMKNEVPFIFLTTSCLSGNFADEAYSNGDSPRQNGKDSVAEELILNPDGGAVAYVGNTLIGLGPVGGVQFNHSVVRAIFQEGNQILGDAMITARATLYSEVAVVRFGGLSLSFPMDLFSGAEWYTLRSEILLGDPSLRIWTQEPQVLALGGDESFSVGYNSLDFVVEKEGAAAAGILVTLDQRGGVLIVKESDQDGKINFRVRLEDGDRVTLTASGSNMVSDSLELNQD